MKTFAKSILAAVLLLMLAISAGAEDYTPVNENISFDYSNNTFTITEGNVAEDTELTVMLVKGDKTGSDLSEVLAGDIYYVGQAMGTSYEAVFDSIGVRYTSGQFEPGVYTLLTSGEGMAVTKTKLVIGNALDKDGNNSEYLPEAMTDGVYYGTVAKSFRVYDSAEEYSYVGIGNFVANGEIVVDNMGFILQQTDGTKIRNGYQSLASLGLDDLSNIKNLQGAVEVGIQLSHIPSAIDVVAIPYTK